MRDKHHTYEIRTSTNIIGTCQLNLLGPGRQQPKRLCCFKAVITSTREIENFPYEIRDEQGLETAAIYGHGGTREEARPRQELFSSSSSSLELCLPSAASLPFSCQLLGNVLKHAI